MTKFKTQAERGADARDFYLSNYRYQITRVADKAEAFSGDSPSKTFRNSNYLIQNNKDLIDFLKRISHTETDSKRKNQNYDTIYPDRPKPYRFY